MRTQVISAALALVALTTVGACGKKDADDRRDTAAASTSTTSGGDIGATGASTQSPMGTAPMDSTSRVSTQNTMGGTTSPTDTAKRTKKP
jgi:ABC-type phosphate transport system substrate-binding protein